MDLTPKSMGVQFNLDVMVSEVRARMLDPDPSTIGYLAETWNKYTHIEQFQLFAFAVLDLATKPLEELKDDGEPT